MRALTSPGVSHREKSGQSCWKNMFFCGLLHFPCDGRVYMSILLSFSVQAHPVWPVWGIFLHSNSLIMTLAVAQLFLFHNCMTGPPCSLAVIIRSIYSICFQHSKWVSLSVSQTDLTNSGSVAHLHLGLNSWHSVSIHFQSKYNISIVLCKKAMSQTSHLPLIVQIFMQHIIHILFYFLR